VLSEKNKKSPFSGICLFGGFPSFGKFEIQKFKIQNSKT